MRFDKRRQAEISIEALNNKLPNLPNAVKPLTVKFANPPSQKFQTYVDLLAQTKAGIANATYLHSSQGMYSPLSSSILGGKAAGQAAGNCNTTSVSAIANGFPATNTTVAGLAQPNLTSWCVFVYNLPSDATDLTLFQLFSKYGAIHSVRVITDHEKKCRGYGFVNMVHYEDALAAIFRLNGYCLERGKPLQVSLKRPKSMSALGVVN